MITVPNAESAQKALLCGVRVLKMTECFCEGMEKDAGTNTEC